MPVFEIKNPSPVTPDPEPQAPRQTEPVESTSPVDRIKHLRRRWVRRRGRAQRSRERTPDEQWSAYERAARTLLNSVNDAFGMRDLKIHLALVRDAGGGYSLNIYDCSDKNVCNLIADIEVPLEGIPELIENLHQELGLVLDTKA